jgi:putative membrane protein
MATADVGPVKEHPRATVAVLSVVGYALVVGTFLGVFPKSVFPDLTLAQVNLLSDAIAVVNTVATLLLLAGWRWIRRNEVRKHAAAMGSAFGLILVFLVMYLTKIGGGGTKEIVIAASGIPGVPADVVYGAYLAMLAVHILLSIVSVPVVLYALVLGVTHTPQELRAATPHRTVGRIAAGAWILSLSLGVVTYLLLNHVYSWEYVTTIVLVPFV